VEDQSPQAEETVAFQHDIDALRGWLVTAMTKLNEREQFIIRERKLRDDPRTLEQLEAAAFAKMRKSLETDASEVHEFLAH